MSQGFDDIILDAYRKGVFPMADSGDTHDFYLVEPKQRALIPILDLHIPRSLNKFMRQTEYEIRIDTAFEDVITACAELTKDRSETWINAPIISIFKSLHKKGHAHSIEYWEQGKLAGGLYGIQVGRIFCGESMFSRTSNASRVALVHLCARLWKTGFKILDAQFMNPHLEQFGAYEIPQSEYVQKLLKLRDLPAEFSAMWDEDVLISEFLDTKN